MLKTINKYTGQIIPLLLIAILLSSCFVIDKSLFRDVITAKYLWVEMFSIVIIALIGGDVFFTKRLKVHLIDILVVVNVLWMVGREFFSEMPHANPQQSLIYIAIYFVVYMFFRLKGSHSLVLSFIIIYLSIVSIQAIIGLLQLYGLEDSHHNLFNITGSFHNPGPFSGFVMSGFPIALGLYLSNRRTRHYRKITRIHIFRFEYEFPFQIYVPNKSALLCSFSKFVFGLLFLVLPVARSRASWLGAVIGSLYVLWFFRKDFRATEKWVIFYNNMTKWWRLKLIAICVCVLCLGFLGIYKLKQGSADGRMLMWQVSWQMVKDKPLLGWGAGGFEAKYGDYQAEWFRSRKGTGEQEMLAGMPDAPFNEMIRIVLTYGLVGVLISIAFIIILFRKNRIIKNQERLTIDNSNSINLKGALLSILCFSLFSYPLDVAPIIIQFIVLCALLVNLKLQEKNASVVIIPRSIQFLTTKISALVLFVSLPIVGNSAWREYKGYQHWKEAYQLYQFQVYDDAGEEYQKATTFLPDNGLLLQMYGKCLCMGEQYSEAKSILKQARLYRSDPILYTALGDTYKALKEYDKAEKAYLYACNINPSRFYPKYLLAKLYVEKGENNMAKSVAKELLSKEVKVESKAIEEIRTELKRLIKLE